MRAAFSTWNGRIAPVFDTAPRITVIDAESRRVVRRAEETLPGGLPTERVMRLTDLGVPLLVCGAISWQVDAMVRAAGIRVVSFIAGTLDEVVAAWLAGKVEREAAFAMPGCRGRRGRGAGRAAGAGAGAGGAGRGAGSCACPACGHRQAHERGAACGGQRCPVCGARMIREQ